MVEHILGSPVDLNNADIFTMWNEHSYAAFVGVLSNIYMKAHASSTFRTTPYKAAIIISDSMQHQYKNQPDTTVERLRQIISRLKTPNGGIELGIFVTNKKGMFSEKAKVGLKHTVSQCWPIVNKVESKDTITANLPPKQLKSGLNAVRYFEYKDIQSALNETPTLLDYYSPIEHVFESLSRSKIHISYQGGTAWLSAAMGIPTVIVHPSHAVNELHLKFKLYGQDLGNINVLDENCMITLVRQHPNEHHTSIKNLQQTLREIK